MEAALVELKKDIRDYADKDSECGWMELSYDLCTLKFPKRALLWYVFGKSPAITPLLPPYRPFSMSGIKMYNDNPFHTDVMLGAGLDYSSAYREFDSFEASALFEAEQKIKDEYHDLISFDFVILSNKFRSSDFNAMVYEYDPPLKNGVWSNSHISSFERKKSRNISCVVIPHAGVEFELATKNADVIITERGGKLSHLATVTREKGEKLLIRVDDAVKKFPVFTRLNIDTDNMKIRIMHD